MCKNLKMVNHQIQIGTIPKDAPRPTCTCNDRNVRYGIRRIHFSFFEDKKRATVKFWINYVEQRHVGTVTSDYPLYLVYVRLCLYLLNLDTL